MTYHSFDEILAANQINEAERIAYTAKWLENNYGIKNPNPEWVTLLSDVHDHDNMPKHFGDTHVGTAFTRMDLILTKIGGSTWHIGVARNGKGKGELIHPKSEASYSENSNQKLRLELIALLKNGKVQQTIGHTNNATLATVTPVSSETIYKKEDDEAREASNLGSSAPVNSLGAKTKSVGIDMSAYL